MSNIDLNFHNVVKITKGDIMRGSLHNHWVELVIKTDDNETINISCWANEQDNLIIKNEES